jgi:transcriptional regulator with XRE-family HTH domain
LRVKHKFVTSSLIAYHADMAGKKSDLGPIGINVTHAVRRCREARGLGYAELSRQLALVGREIPPLGLRRIESGERRVDVDDLVALAAALGVSPITLLMPADADPATPVAVTGVDGEVPAERLWNWLTASGPLRARDLVLAFYGDALPSWERHQMERQLGPTVAGLMDSRAGTAHGDD